MQALGVDLFWMYLVGTASIELSPERPIAKGLHSFLTSQRPYSGYTFCNYSAPIRIRRPYPGPIF